MLAAILAAVSVFLLAVAIFQRERGREREHVRMSSRLQSISRDTPEAEPESLLSEKTYSTIPRLNELLGRLTVTSDLERLLIHAGVHLRVGELVLWMGLIGMLAAAAAYALRGSLPAALVTFWIVGPGLTFTWLRRRRTKRRLAITTLLPDALEMMRSALQAGHSFNHALEMVSEEAPDPLGAEIRQALEELRLGHSVKSALHGIYLRTGIEDLRFFTTAVLLNREVGGNLSDILEVVSNTLRERFKLKGQVRALTAQGRFSAAILTALSPALVAAIQALNPQYLEPLFYTQLGRFMMVYCVCSTAFGYFLLRRIVDIKVVRTD
jgi:tight adherence protein B